MSCFLFSVMSNSRKKTFYPRVEYIKVDVFMEGQRMANKSGTEEIVRVEVMEERTKLKIERKMRPGNGLPALHVCVRVRVCVCVCTPGEANVDIGKERRRQRKVEESK